MINLRMLTPIGLAMITAFGIVCVARLFFRDFFFIDDAQSAFLPFVKEIGRIWLSGHLPILTTNTYLGGNLLVDMVYSPFAPQVVLTGLLANQVESFRLAANFFAWLNISLVIAGAYWLGRIFTIRPSYSLLLGFIVATNPVFLFVYCASWWNFASAFAWLVVSFAALLQFRTNQNAGVFLTAVLSLCFLFASAGTHMQLVYIVSFIVIIIFDIYEYRDLKRLSYFILIALCAGFISAIPLMSEYAVNSSMFERFSDFNNFDNFLVPSWGHIVNSFNPFYATYIYWFGGYKYIPLSLGYIGIIGVLLFFIANRQIEYTINHRILFTLALVLLVLSFSSSQFGPIRYPFRYLPALEMFLASLVILHIDKAQFRFSKQMHYQFIGIVVCAAFIQFFSADTLIFKSKNIIFSLLFIALCIALSYFFFKFEKQPKQQIFLLWTISVLAWVGILAQTHSLGKKYHMAYHKNLTEHISGLAETPSSSYALGLTPTAQNKNLDATDLGSADALLYGKTPLKSINGYSPVGHTGINRILPYPSPHGIFNPYETIKNICQLSDLRADVFMYQLLNIGVISVWKTDITPEIAVLIAQAGLRIEPYPVGERVLIKPVNPKIPEGSLTYQTVDDSIKFNHQDGMSDEWYDVAKADVERTLVFSRVFWRGYHAVINEEQYPVTAYRDALVKVTIPPGVSGQMHLYYQPMSWQYTRWIFILGLILCGWSIFNLKLNTRQ